MTIVAATFLCIVGFYTFLSVYFLVQVVAHWVRNRKGASPMIR
jgi:hypothetical protein